jgi:hypothetical protein
MNPKASQFAFGKWQFAICNNAEHCEQRAPLSDRPRRSPRRGGTYIAVLGTSLLVALLAIAALTGQRIQNRLLASAAEIRQAELNANTAVELALLAMKQDPNWRTTYSNGSWFANRGTAAGTCSASVTDPLDGNLANTADDPVVIVGIGSSGQAEQRVQVTVDSLRGPLSCLRSAVAVGDSIDLSGDTLRTNGLITANQISASSSQVYGTVEAVTVSGSTYNGTSTQINSSKRPTMPDWANVFQYYRDNATNIPVTSLQTWTQINLGRNINMESAISSSDWTGSAPNIPTCQVSQSNNYNRTSGGTYSLRVQNRNAWYAGPAQPIDAYVKPGQQYYVEAYVYLPLLAVTRNFHISLYTKGSGSAQFNTTSDTLVLGGLGWVKLSGNITAPSWTGSLEYAFVKIAGSDTLNTADFYLDDFLIRETTTGRVMYRQSLGPGRNPYGTANAQGLYKIDCTNQKVIIERSRINGTLVLINPGAGTCIGNSGPICMSPAVAGYPVLLVDANTADNADILINASNRSLSEKEDSTNFNPTGVPHDEFSIDTDTNDIYRSEIYGLILVEDDVTYQNRALVRGQIVAGDDILNSSGELEIEFQTDSLLNPPPGLFAPYTYQRRAASAQKALAP